jgi:hypothetical protein
VPVTAIAAQTRPGSIHAGGLRNSGASAPVLRQRLAGSGEYFPQVRFSGAYGSDGLLHPAYAQALHAAQEWATPRAIATSKALLIQPVRLCWD